MQLETPTSIANYFDDTSVIYALELLAAALTLFELRISLAHKKVISPIDNNASLCALIRWAARIPLIDKFAALFRDIATEYNIAIWLERVSIASNIADRPPMGRTDDHSCDEMERVLASE